MASQSKAEYETIFSYAAKIISRSEIFHDSVRNSLFKFFGKLDKEGKRTSRKIYNTVYHFCMETVRRRNLLDAYITRAFGKQIWKKDVFVLELLRLACYVLKEQEFKSKTRPTAAEISSVIFRILLKKNPNSSLEWLEEGMRRISKENKKILLSQAASPMHRISLELFHPIWLVQYLIDQLGMEEATALMNANNRPKNVWIRVRTPLITVKEAIKNLKREGILTKKDIDIPDLLYVKKSKKPLVFSRGFQEKWIVIQSKASSAVSHMLNPQKGDTIVDMAAAPGMKTMHILDLLSFQEGGNLIALDISNARLANMRKNLENSCFNGVNYLRVDSKMAPLRSNVADKVLVDAPCSSTGILGMYPDHKWYSQERIGEFARIQKSMMVEALRVLKPGGTGVYSVCSLMFQEGEGIMESFGGEIEFLDPKYGVNAYKTREKWIFRRMFPHLHRTQGFFFAKFKKTSEITKS